MSTRMKNFGDIKILGHNHMLEERIQLFVSGLRKTGHKDRGKKRCVTIFLHRDIHPTIMNYKISFHFHRATVSSWSNEMKSTAKKSL
jgi:hypothetical protein